MNGAEGEATPVATPVEKAEPAKAVKVNERERKANIRKEIRRITRAFDGIDDQIHALRKEQKALAAKARKYERESEKIEKEIDALQQLALPKKRMKLVTFLAKAVYPPQVEEGGDGGK
jgi:peptidoglycan hydrolase CwlO-like protein